MIPNVNVHCHYLSVLHTLGLVLALMLVAVSAVLDSLEAWWWLVGSNGSSDEVCLKFQEVRFVTTMSCIRQRVLVVLLNCNLIQKRTRPIRSANVMHQLPDTGFLVRRGLGSGAEAC